MPCLSSRLALALVLPLLACGGASSTSLGSDSTGQITNTAGGRTMSATVNGVDFKPTTLNSVYASNVVAISATDGKHSLTIQGVGVTTPGTYSVAINNPNSLRAEWIDETGTYSSLVTGGSGTVTYTVLQLGRVAGSFNYVARNQLASGSAVNGVSVVGTFDIKFP